MAIYCTSILSTSMQCSICCMLTNSFRRDGLEDFGKVPLNIKFLELRIIYNYIFRNHYLGRQMQKNFKQIKSTIIGNSTGDSCQIELPIYSAWAPFANSSIKSEISPSTKLTQNWSNRNDESTCVHESLKESLKRIETSFSQFSRGKKKISLYEIKQASQQKNEIEMMH